MLTRWETPYLSLAICCLLPRPSSWWQSVGRCGPAPPTSSLTWCRGPRWCSTACSETLASSPRTELRRCLEATAGFALGTLVALAGATAMAHSRLMERALFPVAVLVKVTPLVAYAPLFVIWFGFGSMPKVLVAALITFFPVLVNAMIGFRSVSPETLDLLRSLRASNREIFLKLRVPGSLPYLFAAFRISIPLSVIGATVGEYFGGGDRGLGSVIVVAHYDLDMPTLFSAGLTLAIIGIGLTILTAYAERRVLFWHDSSIVPERGHIGLKQMTRES